MGHLYIRFLAALLAAAASLAAAEGREDRWPTRERWNFDFGASVISAKPMGDFRTRLDGRHGVGIGAQWTEFRDDRWLKRTRLEWLTYRDSDPVGPAQVRTQMKTITLSFDQVIHFAPEPIGPYVVFGLGGLRSFYDESTPTARRHLDATRLLVTGGLGLRLANQVSLEARYSISSLQKSQDAATVQFCMGWHF